MNTYEVSILEKNWGFITVEASSEEEAEKKALKACYDGTAPDTLWSGSLQYNVEDVAQV